MKGRCLLRLEELVAVLPHPLLLAVPLLLLLVAVPVPRPLLLVAVLVLVKEPPLLMPRQLVWMLRLRLPLLVARNKISVLVPEVRSGARGGVGRPGRAHPVGGGGNWIVNPTNGNAIKIYGEDASNRVKQPAQLVKTYAELLATGQVTGNEARYNTKQEALDAGADTRAGGRARDAQGRMARVPAAERTTARRAFYNTRTNRANLLGTRTKVPEGAIVRAGDPRAARQNDARTGRMETQVQATERDAKRQATEAAVAAGISKSKTVSKRAAQGLPPINRKPTNPNSMYIRAGKVPKNRPEGERAWILVGGPTYKDLVYAGEDLSQYDEVTLAEREAQSAANSAARNSERRSTGPNARRANESIEDFRARGGARLAEYRNEEFDLVVQNQPSNRPIGVQHADGTIVGSARKLAHETGLAAGASDAQVVAHIKQMVRNGTILLPLSRKKKMSERAPVRGQENQV